MVKNILKSSTMRTGASSILFLFFFPCYIYAQNPLDLLKGKGSSNNSGELVTGLKEALEKGVQTASGRLSRENGFLQDAAVKILLPPEV
ncbi:MAG: DUF4197 family protein, partial [Chlamydiota bacterium]